MAQRNFLSCCSTRCCLILLETGKITLVCVNTNNYFKLLLKVTKIFFFFSDKHRLFFKTVFYQPAASQ